MKLFCSICMCLFAPFLTRSQNSEVLNELLELELAIYQSEEVDQRAALLLKKAGIWIAETDYQNALGTLERINVYATNDSLKNETVEMKSLTYYLSSEFALAKNAILEASLESWFAPSKDLRLIEVLTEVELEKFSEAEAMLINLNPNLDVSSIFNIRKLKKEEKAFNLSLILPGSGQMYAGYFFKGLTSIALQAVCVYGGVTGLRDRYFFSQALPSVAVFQGFYFGGADYAKNLVTRRNEQIKTELSATIVNQLK